VRLENSVENIIIFIMGSICGVSIYRGVSTILGAGIGITMFRQAEFNCLQLLALSLEDASNMKTTKQMLLESAEYPNNVIKLTRNTDSHELSIWKREAINRLINSYPANYKRIVQYSTWSEAMNYFHKQKKNICFFDD
jgi:hypothetical protein